MRVRFHQHPNRNEGPCVFPQWNQRVEKHKVPPAYSRADEGACSLYGPRDDDPFKRWEILEFSRSLCSPGPQTQGNSHKLGGTPGVKKYLAGEVCT